MDHQSQPVPLETAAGPERAAQHHAPARPRISLVPHYPAGSGELASDAASDNSSRADTPALWVSASGLWPPLYVNDAAVRSGAYRLGCCRQHDPAEPCDIADCHGRPTDAADPASQQASTEFWRRSRLLDDQTQDVALLAMWLIGYIVHRADPAIAYVCLDWSDNGDYLLPGLYRIAESDPLADSELSDRLDFALTSLATSLTLDNERTWFPFTTDHQSLKSDSGSLVDSEVWLIVAELLTITPPAGTTEVSAGKTQSSSAGPGHSDCAEHAR